MRPVNLAALAFAVALATAACSGGTAATPAAPASAPPAASSPAAAPGATGSQVQIASFAFAPATITVPVGSTVTWTNKDNAGHTVTAGDGSFKSDTLRAGATFSHTFAAAGAFAYSCAIHPSMKATVTVE